jgi:outer membrane protein TolC
LRRCAPATATAEQRRALLLDLQQSILIDVARAYFLVLRSEQSVEVLTNSIAVQEERVADIRARQRVGFAKALDTAQTEAQAAATRVTLIDARNGARRGRELLELLTAVPIGDRPLVETIEAPPTEMPVESFESLGLDRRQDLAAVGVGDRLGPSPRRSGPGRILAQRLAQRVVLSVAGKRAERQRVGRAAQREPADLFGRSD